MRDRLVATAIAATVVLTVGACGGGGSGGSGGSAGKHDDAETSYKASAAKICKDHFAELLKSSAGIKNPSAPTQAEKTLVVDKIVSELTSEHADLKALTPPASLATGVQTLLGSLQKVIDQARNQGTAFVKVGSHPFDQLDADARAIGLSDCAH